MTKPSETTVALIKHDGVVATIECTHGSFSFTDGTIHLGGFSGVFSFNPEPKPVESKKEDDGGKHDIDNGSDEVASRGSKVSSVNYLESDDDEGSDSDGCKELGKHLLTKCVLEVYSDEDFEEDEFLSQESELLGDMRRFASREGFDD